MEYTKKKSSSFILNTFIIVITGFLIKALGLINRIFITRIMGPNQINLYIMSFPTIMLFISLSGMSLNITVSKTVSESLKTKKYSPIILLKKSIKISLITSLITLLIFGLSLKFIASNLLKNDDLILPLSSTFFLIPLVGISDSLRGYFNGLKQMEFSAKSALLEQIGRISFSIIFLIIFIPFGTKIATFFCLLSLSIGEIVSIIYSAILIKKSKIIHFENTSNESKAILNMAIPSTLSHLVGNFTYFLEPIIYVWILSTLNYSNAFIEETYTTLNAYTLSLLTIGSFISTSVAVTIVPQISENYAIKDYKNVQYYIKKTILFSLIPGILITIILYNFPSELMMFVYRTNSGSMDVKRFVFLFLPYYLQAPFSSILQAMGKAKKLFILTSLFDILRLLLIVILSFIPHIGYDSLIFSTFITLDLYFLILVINIIKLSHLKITFNQSVSLILISIFTFLFCYLIKMTKLSFLIVIPLISFTYLLLIVSFELIKIPKKITSH